MTDKQSKYSVLIVDDDKFLLDMYAVKFNERGFAVQTAIGGEDALNKLRDGLKPTAILLDLVMPAMDGFAVLEALQKEDIGGDALPIILSNQGQESEIARAKQLGAVDYIVKASAIPTEVLEKVTATIEKHAKQ